MNHEILRSVASKEYIKSFLERGIRPDKRKLEEKREFNDISNFINTEEFSQMTSLGHENRVIGVLKKKENPQKSTEAFVIKIDVSQLDLNENLILEYINKLLKDNIHYYTNDYIYELHVRILSNSGNIYDSISHMLLILFNNQIIKSNLFYIKNQFSTLTFSCLDEYILYDTSIDEVNVSNSVFNLIPFADKSFFLHKISGRSISILDLNRIIEDVSK